MATSRHGEERDTKPLPPFDPPLKAGTVRSMRSNRSKDTKPEVEVRRLLHQGGLRFRKSFVTELENFRTVVDIAFPRLRLALFIDGCFWHSCPEHGHVPKTNVAYWTAKLERNSSRDREVDRQLAEHGWQVMRFWSHSPPVEIASEVANAVTDLREQAHSSQDTTVEGKGQPATSH